MHSRSSLPTGHDCSRIIVTLTGQLVGVATPLEDGNSNPQAGDEEAANKRLKTDGAASDIPNGDADAEATDASTQTAPSSVAAVSRPVIPTLDVLPTALTSAARSAAAQPLHVGDLRLADLRRAMQSAGHTAEFRGEGTLVIDGAVAVKKTATGRVELESVGLPSDGGPAMQMGGTFYAVKRMIYEGLAVVAGA